MGLSNIVHADIGWFGDICCRKIVFFIKAIWRIVGIPTLMKGDTVIIKIKQILLLTFE